MGVAYVMWLGLQLFAPLTTDFFRSQKFGILFASFCRNYDFYVTCNLICRSIFFICLCQVANGDILHNGKNGKRKRNHKKLEASKMYVHLIRNVHVYEQVNNGRIE